MRAYASMMHALSLDSKHATVCHNTYMYVYTRIYIHTIPAAQHVHNACRTVYTLCQKHVRNGTMNTVDNTCTCKRA